MAEKIQLSRFCHKGRGSSRSLGLVLKGPIGAVFRFNRKQQPGKGAVRAEPSGDRLQLAIVAQYLDQILKCRHRVRLYDLRERDDHLIPRSHDKRRFARWGWCRRWGRRRDGGAAWLFRGLLAALAVGPRG